MFCKWSICIFHISYLEYVQGYLTPSCPFRLCSLRCPIIVASKLQCLYWYLTPSFTDFFAFFKLLCSCNVCKGISHFHELPSSVLQGLHLYFFFICTICTRTLESFMHLFFVFFKISYHNCFKAAMFVWYMNSSCTDFWCPLSSPFWVNSYLQYLQGYMTPTLNFPSDPFVVAS